MKAWIRYWMWCFLGCCLFQQPLKAQKGIDINRLNNLRKVVFTGDSVPYKLDSLSIFPASLIVSDVEQTTLSPDDYSLDWQSGRISITNPAYFGQELKAVFRVLPYTIQPFYAKKQFPGYARKDTIWMDPYFYDPSYAILQENPFDFGGLNYNGSFARGISFGNNQDLVVNSTLDLQLSGTIGDIEILAALTDNNIPIQPDGTTQQIQDFDQVYIQVTTGQHKFVAGDYTIQSRDHYFVRFDKQLQGASYKTGFKFGKDWETNHSVSFAVAKGKFSRNQFFGREGDQGPYKLTGINGETFIIILAGSERVFADGRKLQRGENNDYIMDYNTGEIIFTPNFLMTKFIRIVVEFEYAERYYFRSLIHSAHSIRKKGLRLYADIYSEQDSRNRPILANVDSLGEAIMKSVGNNISQAIVPGFRPAEYNPSRIQYRLTDTIVDGFVYDSVFVLVNAPQSGVYDLNFSFVGQGLGNYVPDRNALNQRAYRWIAPVNGIPQGSFEPVVQLITPKQDQYAVLGMDYKINTQTRVRSEWSLSNRDPNIFSDLGNADNRGLAAFNSVERRDTIGKKNWLLDTKASYEWRTENYQPPEQYRPVEFARDWNQFGTDRAMEHFVTAGIQLSNNEHRFRSGAEVTSFNRTGLFSGFQQRYFADFQKNNWDIRGDMRWLSSNGEEKRSDFLRPTLHLGRTFSKMKGLYTAIGGFMEYNDLRIRDSDTLSPQAYYFNNLYAQIRTADTSAWTAQFEYRYRADFFPVVDEFRKLNIGHDISINGIANRLKNQNLSWRFTYRDFISKDSLITGSQSDRNFLGRIEYGFRVKKGAIRFNALYELGSGQERVREFTYLEVPPGQGLYQWLDENSDGVQQLNEFVIAQFPDSARFVRVLTNVNEFIQARLVLYNQVIQLNPKAVWYNEEGFKKFLSRFNVNSTITLNRRTFKGAEVSPFNPFLLNSEDPNVISLNSAFRNSVFFNQGSPKYYINYTWFLNQDKVLLVNGFDTRRRQDQTLETNFNIVKTLTGNIKLAAGRNSYTSDFFEQNNFDLGIIRVTPTFTWLYKTLLRSSVGYEFENKLNPPELGGELARANKLNFDFRYSQVGKQTVEVKFSFINFDYNGLTGTAKSFQILEGLQPGQNYIWTVSYDRNLNNNLQLNLSYNGRKTGTDGPVIHNGQAALRALF